MYSEYSRDCDHRHSGLDAPARAEPGEGNREEDQMHRHSETVRNRIAPVRRRERRLLGARAHEHHLVPEPDLDEVSRRSL